MNKIQEFLNEKFGEVRVVNINNVLWFVAKDVALVLKYATTQKVTQKIDDEDIINMSKNQLTNLGNWGQTGGKDVKLINESGLYQVVGTITKKDKDRYNISRDFKRWITGTVIPAIRKDGAYINGEENINMNNEEQEAKLVLKAMNILQKKIDRLKKENSEMKPKVDKWSRFLDTNGTYNFTEVGKLISTMAREEQSDINISVQKLTKFLRSEGVLSKVKSPDKEREDGSVKRGTYKNLPNKDYEDYFNVNTVHISNKFDKTQTRVKANGVEFIYDLVKEKYKIA